MSYFPNSERKSQKMSQVKLKQKSRNYFYAFWSLNKCSPVIIKLSLVTNTKNPCLVHKNAFNPYVKTFTEWDIHKKSGSKWVNLDFLSWKHFEQKYLFHSDLFDLSFFSSSNSKIAWHLRIFVEEFVCFAINYQLMSQIYVIKSM